MLSSCTTVSVRAHACRPRSATCTASPSFRWAHRLVLVLPLCGMQRGRTAEQQQGAASESAQRGCHTDRRVLVCCSAAVRVGAVLPRPATRSWSYCCMHACSLDSAALCPQHHAPSARRSAAPAPAPLRACPCPPQPQLPPPWSAHREFLMARCAWPAAYLLAKQALLEQRDAVAALTSQQVGRRWGGGARGVQLLGICC